MGKRPSVAKFPVARIKKIMQADEDVGKLASATPVLVSKSLELFMQSILDATLKQAQQRGTRKLTAVHLKRAIHESETFDFLKDIVSKVQDDGKTGGAANEDGKRKKRKTEKEAEESD